MRTFVGQVVGFDPGHVTFRLPCGTRKRLRAGEATRRQALSLLGRNVRFQAQLSEETESLASPLFVVGSSFGIQAVCPAGAEPERVCSGALADLIAAHEQRHLDDLERLRVAEVRVKDLEYAVTVLTKSRDISRQDKLAAEAEVARLTAEVERLRRTVEPQRTAQQDADFEEGAYFGAGR